MILYKYYPYESGLIALKNQSYGFRNPDFFNDPFELSFIEKTVPKTELHERLIEISKQSWVSILSLTDNPLNSLMWAHYAVDHKGFVIGYDVDDDFLTSHEYNIIPICEGKVEYTDSYCPIEWTEQNIKDFYAACDFVQSRHGTTPIEIVKQLKQFRPFTKEASEIVRYMFLYKHSYWKYENEYRVVKSTSKDSRKDYPDAPKDPKRLYDMPGYTYGMVNDRTSVGKMHSQGLYVYDQHKAKIKEVYLGLRNPLLRNIQDKYVKFEDNSLQQLSEENDWKVYRICFQPGEWELSSEVVDRNVLNERKTSDDMFRTLVLSPEEIRFIYSHINKLPDGSSNVRYTYDGNSYHLAADNRPVVKVTAT